MVPDVVYHLYSENLDIKLQCSLAIFKCASNKVSLLIYACLRACQCAEQFNRKFVNKVQNVNQF